MSISPPHRAATPDELASEDDEAPRSKKARRAPYHHGNLPEALVAAARELLEQEGSDALTLRAVARRVGVTHAAPYRHFKDKQALLEGVAADGMAQLARALGDAATSAVDPRAAVEAVGRAYLRFAAEHDALFATMFDVRLPPQARGAHTRHAAEVRACFARALRSAPLDAVDPRAGVLWALWHGVALLDAAGSLEAPAAVADAAAEASMLLGDIEPIERTPRSTLHPKRSAEEPDGREG
jgi:AcrR family transcriptional regulator